VGERLVVDVDLLESTAERLTSIVTAFEDADSHAGRVADAVGDDKLADAVRDFADKWRGRRGKMKDAIANLAELTTAAGSQFREVDTELADSLTSERTA
jgi:ABC-type transporter Mla subunit MlaD